MVDFILIVASFVAGFLLVGSVRRFCAAKGMMNEVTARSSHVQPTVRGGGLSFVLLGLPAFALVAGLSPDFPSKSFVLALTAGAAVVAFMGWLDDVRSRSPLVRLAVQMICVGVALAFLPPLFPDVAPVWVEKTVLLFGWVWFVNLYNFMDGIDGLAAGEAVFLCVALALLTVAAPLKPALLVLAGACLGFLRLNLAKHHKVFMGDVGSTFLGYLLAGILLWTLAVSGDGARYFFPLLVLPAVFWADATCTLFKRTFKGQKPWQAHREHWYQRAAQLGFSHLQVTGRAMLMNGMLFLLAVAGISADWGVFTLLPVCFLLGWAAWRIRYLENVQ